MFLKLLKVTFCLLKYVNIFNPLSLLKLDTLYLIPDTVSMVIGFDASRAFVKDERSSREDHGRTGTENYSYQLLRAISETDKNNSYLIYLRPGQMELVKKEAWPDNFQFSVINYQYLWTQVGLAIRTLIDPLDLLFVPAHTLPLIRNPILKTVITVHDLGSEYLPAMHQLKQVLYLKFMTYIQLKTATKIIAVSKATKLDLMKKVGISSEKIKVVYEGIGNQFKIQNSKFKIDGENDSQRDILKQYGLEKNKYFLFVGTIQPRKNLERLIRAFVFFARGPAASASRRMSSVTPFPAGMRQEPSFASPLAFKNANFKLVLAGQKGWKSDGIYSLPKELGIEKSVVFTGRISDQELSLLYKDASALVFVSLFEGFGLPILEAFASGCPVICSNISSMPEVAGRAGLTVNPYSEDDIADAMLRIAKNDKLSLSEDKLRDAMILLGYSRVKDFSWEKAAKETLEVFREIAGK